MIKLAFSNKYIYKLPDGHRFPIEKYELVKEQLVYEGAVEETQIYDPGLVDEELILAVHDNDYWQQLKHLSLPEKKKRQIGLPVTEMSVKRARNSVAGTVTSAQNALSNGIGLNLSGGTHHAYRTHGEGFCLLNDLAIAAVKLLDSYQVSKILVVDLDVHQGNGTAKIFENDDRVYTFSMHGENNYPLHKETSNLDVALPKNTGDEVYLESLNKHLNSIMNHFEPDFIFYQSGVDVMKNDRLGKLALTKSGVRLRDQMVIETAKNGGIPLVITMGGGYNAKLTDLIDAHCNTFRTAIDYYS